MTRSILVVLDVDTDATVLTRYATDIASRHDAKLTALVAADPTLQERQEGDQNGSQRDAEITQTKADVKRLLNSFEETTHSSNIAAEVLVEESVSFQRILDDSRYHDLVIVGHDPNFFVRQPKQRTKTLARVVKGAIPPTLVVRESHQKIERVIVTYDGSSAAARTMQRFVQLLPFGAQIQVKVLCAHESTSYDLELVLHLAKDYLEKHDLEVETEAVSEVTVHEELLARTNRLDTDLVVVGAHANPTIPQLAFGSTAAALLKQGKAPLFMHY